MNTELSFYSLHVKMGELGIPKNYYSIGKYGEEALCIIYEDGKWHVFEGERGKRFNLHSFENELDACNCFVERIKTF